MNDQGNMEVNEQATQAPSSSSSSSGKKKRMQVLKFKGVGLWAWDMVVNNCAICRNSIMDLCIECQAEQKPLGGTDCSVTLGKCNHSFHSHCISRWLKHRRVCPLDNSEWNKAPEI